MIEIALAEAIPVSGGGAQMSTRPVAKAILIVSLIAIMCAVSGCSGSSTPGPGSLRLEITFGSHAPRLQVDAIRIFSQSGQQYAPSADWY